MDENTRKKIHDIAREVAPQDSKTSLTPSELERLHKIAKKEAEKHK
ncbi:hypothetical protein [Gracilibacillus lacisalsi]|nr:hypothetical protein [Gracilibacillus lacisalsi]